MKLSRTTYSPCLSIRHHHAHSDHNLPRNSGAAGAMTTHKSSWVEHEDEGRDAKRPDQGRVRLQLSVLLRDFGVTCVQYYTTTAVHTSRDGYYTTCCIILISVKIPEFGDALLYTVPSLEILVGHRYFVGEPVGHLKKISSTKQAGGAENA